MDIKTIQALKPQRIPETPKELVDYMIMGEKARNEFNKYNPGYWLRFDSNNEENPGFFYVLRAALSHNETYVNLLKEELRRPENRHHFQIIQDKIKEFYKELYVGPMIGSLPYFKKWAIPNEVMEQERERAKEKAAAQPAFSA